MAIPIKAVSYWRGIETPSRFQVKYQPEIDGLRAIAVLPVIFYHAGFDAFTGGYVGVDVFFVISGYLITAIIVEEIRQEKFSVVNFYERRARRILPALFFVTLSCIPFAWAWMTPADFKDFSQSIVAVATFSSNIFFWLETSYFAPDVELKPLLHTWSLAVEEQFYLFFPLMLVFFSRRKLATSTVVVLAISIASFSLAIYASKTEPAAGFYLIPTRAWELGVGAMLVLLAVKSKPGDILGKYGATVGIILIGVAIHYFTDAIPFPGWYALVPVIGTALVIVYGSTDIVLGSILRARACVFIGLISYSLYLWHQPILAFMRLRWNHEMTLLSAISAIILAFVMAILSWRFVEAPFRNRRTISFPQTALAGSVAASVLLLIGFSGHMTDGFAAATEQRLEASRVEARLRTNWGFSEQCNGDVSQLQECRRGDKPEIAVWGDSYAMHLIQGLAASAPEAGLIQFTKSFCGPLPGVAPINSNYPEAWSKSCNEFNAKVWRWLGQNDTVKYVVMSSPFSQYLIDGGSLYTERGLRSTDIDFVASKFIETMNRLETLGIKPIILSPPPVTGRNIGRCLVRHHYLELELDACDIRREDYLRIQSEMRELLMRVDEEHRVLWLEDTMCVDEQCLASIDGIFFYSDRGHLSHEGSAFLGQHMGWYSLIRGMDAANEREAESDASRKSGSARVSRDAPGLPLPE